jgi:hypothetical protein
MTQLENMMGKYIKEKMDVEKDIHYLFSENSENILPSQKELIIDSKIKYLSELNNKIFILSNLFGYQTETTT